MEPGEAPKKKRRKKRPTSRRALWLLLLLWLASLSFMGAAISDLYAEVGVLQSTHAVTADRLRELERKIEVAATQEELEAIARELVALAQSVQDAHQQSTEAAQPVGPASGQPLSPSAAQTAASTDVGAPPNTRPSLFEQIAKALSSAFRPRPVLP